MEITKSSKKSKSNEINKRLDENNSEKENVFSSLNSQGLVKIL